MTPDAGEIEAVQKAKVVNLVMESVVFAVTALVYVRLLLSDDVRWLLKRKVERVRYALFGPPPPTEEEIKAMAEQVQIEALRVVRYPNEH